jgi:hypothetical protein
MTLRNVLALLLLPFFIGACSAKNKQTATGKQEYLASVKKMSYDELKQRLKRDIAFLDQLIDSAKGVSLYLNFSISGSSGDKTVKSPDTAAHFQLPVASAIGEEFAILKNSVLAEQYFALPQSGFRFSVNHNLEVIDGDDVQYTIDKVFTGGRELPLTQLKLQRVDSMQIQASYSYATAYDTVVIRRSDKDSVRYGNVSIRINEQKDNEVTLSLPVALNNKVIGYQAVNSNDVLMSPSGHSSMPVIGVSYKVMGELDDFKASLAKAMVQSSKEAAWAELEKIPDHFFENRNRVEQLLKEMNKIDQLAESDLSFRETMQIIKKFQATYKNILGPREQTLELKFPGDMDQLYLFIATQYDSLRQNVIAFDASEQKGNEVYFDEAENKYGIIDPRSNIIIPAKFERLTKQDDQYFVAEVDTNETTYYLNIKEKKLEQIAADKKVVSQLTKELVVFSDKEDYEGVLRNNKEEVVPFKYDRISLTGDILVAEGSKRGRSFYEFYTTAGRKIDIEPIKKVVTAPGNNNIVLLFPNKKYGVINRQGEISISGKYPYINFLTDNKSSLMVYAEAGQDGDRIYGTIAADGKTVSPAAFSYIGDLNEGMVSFRLAANNEDRPLYGFLNGQGAVQIPAKFDKVGDYINGFALASLNNELGLIDRNGNTTVTFPGGKEAEVTVLDRDKRTDDACYEINGKLYNYKGEPVKK